MARLISTFGVVVRIWQERHCERAYVTGLQTNPRVCRATFAGHCRCVYGEVPAILATLRLLGEVVAAVICHRPDKPNSTGVVYGER
jgi:hypothetical protein